MRAGHRTGICRKHAVKGSGPRALRLDWGLWLWRRVEAELRFREAFAVRRLVRGCFTFALTLTDGVFCVFLSEQPVKLGFASVRAFQYGKCLLFYSFHCSLAFLGHVTMLAIFAV